MVFSREVKVQMPKRNRGIFAKNVNLYVPGRSQQKFFVTQAFCSGNGLNKLRW